MFEVPKAITVCCSKQWRRQEFSMWWWRDLEWKPPEARGSGVGTPRIGQFLQLFNKNYATFTHISAKIAILQQ